MIYHLGGRWRPPDHMVISRRIMNISCMYHTHIISLPHISSMCLHMYAYDNTVSRHRITFSIMHISYRIIHISRSVSCTYHTYIMCISQHGIMSRITTWYGITSWYGITMWYDQQQWNEHRVWYQDKKSVGQKSLYITPYHVVRISVVDVVRIMHISLYINTWYHVVWYMHDTVWYGGTDKQDKWYRQTRYFQTPRAGYRLIV